MALGVKVGPFIASTGATKGKQKRQIALAQQQLSVEEDQIAQLKANEKAAFDRWYFTLTSLQKAEYDVQASQKAFEAASSALGAARRALAKSSSTSIKLWKTTASIPLLVCGAAWFPLGGWALVICGVLVLLAAWWTTPMNKRTVVENQQKIADKAEAELARNKELYAVMVHSDEQGVEDSTSHE